ncbi:crotonase/enoyl-CoA hydratase family protein [Nocardioides hungaricus]
MTEQHPGIAPGLSLERDDDVAVLRVARPHKRNALDDETVRGLGAFFAAPPEWARVCVLTGEGPHFSAGLDLGSLSRTSTLEGVRHSMMWHRAFEAIESGQVPVVAALHGAVIGGGLELALAAHVRVADATAFYSLPEGQHGLFVGGGASVRLPRVIGAHRMTDLMLTGRRLDAEEGQLLGISTYLTPAGGGPARAVELARRIARNAPVTNFAVLQALPRIAEASPGTGLFLESLMAGVAQGSDDAKARMHAFLDGRREASR